VQPVLPALPGREPAQAQQRLPQRQLPVQVQVQARLPAWAPPGGRQQRAVRQAWAAALVRQTAEQQLLQERPALVPPAQAPVPVPGPFPVPAPVPVWQ
jgi:hypothetical protein